ncbi:hypothetical protein ABWL39_09685 [Chitinivorax sp. PXF-14]|uniref:hypothetical protein n=1 Tax=Chitinivorax sp. PXF-14 TaxID=3230488 RepID=UPI0034651B36
MIAEFRFSRDELRRLLRPLLIFGTAVVCVTGAVAGTWYYHSRVEAELAEARGRLSQALAGVESAEVAHRDWSAYDRRFRDLQQAGIVGAEDRLQWAEALEQIARGSPELGLKYEIEPRKALPAQFGSAQELPIYASTLRLNFGARHEEQIRELIRAVRHDIKGLTLLKACHVARDADKADSLGLGAVCELLLISFDKPATAAEETPQ